MDYLYTMFSLLMLQLVYSRARGPLGEFKRKRDGVQREVALPLVPPPGTTSAFTPQSQTAASLTFGTVVFPSLFFSPVIVVVAQAGRTMGFVTDAIAGTSPLLLRK